ncbi:MAG: energy transducer TonB [Bacteroidota bacterium]
METKKTERANLENKKTIFFQIGLLVAMTLALIAFEWTTRGKNSTPVQQMGMLTPLDEDIINTFRDVPPPPAPPPPVQPLDFNIRENTYEIEPVDMDWSSETSQEEMINPYDYFPEEPEETTDEIFVFVADMPQFNGGGLENFASYVYQNLKYPPKAAEYGIDGKVTVEFVVEKDGSLSSFDVERSPHELLENEVLRVITKSPKWTPGKQRGKPVRVRYFLPITFKLQ